MLKKIEKKVDLVNTNMTQMATSFSSKVSSLEAIIYELKGKIDTLHHTLHAQAIQHRLDPHKEQ